MVPSLRLGDGHVGCICPDVFDAALLIMEAQEVPVRAVETRAEPARRENLAVVSSVVSLGLEDMNHEVLPLPVRIGVIRLRHSNICYAAFKTNSGLGRRQYLPRRTRSVCPS